VDGYDIGVGDVYGEYHIGVDDWKHELEGSEVDFDQMKSWVFWLGTD